MHYNNNMNNNDFEENFMQNVKQTLPQRPQQPSNQTSAQPSKLPLIIAIVSVFIALVELVVIVFLIVNNYETEDDITADDSSDFEISTSTPFSFDDEGNISAFDLTCTAENGDKYTFSKAKKYTKTSASSSTSSGIYSTVKGTAIILNNTESEEEAPVLYYDGEYVFEHTTPYECISEE